MRPELEIIEYLQGSDQTLEQLRLACPDRDMLLVVLRRLFDEGSVYIRVREGVARSRDLQQHEVRAWAWDPPPPEKMPQIVVGLTERGLAKWK